MRPAMPALSLFRRSLRPDGRPGPWFWILMLALALAEVLALALVCQVQVQRAQWRDALERVHETVVVHCLDQIRAMSIGSCRERFSAPP